MSENNTIISDFSSLCALFPNKAYISMEACNDLTLPAEWEFTNRINSIFHLAYVKQGCVIYYVNEIKHILQAGDIIFVGAGVNHSRFFIASQLPRMILTRFNIHCPSYTIKPFSFISSKKSCVSLLQKVYTSYTAPNTLLTHERTSLKMADFLLSLEQEIVASNTSSVTCETRLCNVANYIKSNPTESISTQSLAQIADLSPNYFRQRFYKQYGMTPKQFQIKERIIKACNLLSETSLSINQIANIIGYSDAFAFSKQFKQVMGYPPSKYKR